MKTVRGEERVGVERGKKERVEEMGEGGMSRVWIKVKPGTVGTDEKGGQREERGERVEV